MDNERRIEKLLRAFAKKRKDDAGAPLELHPATRRLLQDEATRLTKKAEHEGSSFWKILFGTTPRRAFAVCALASLIVTGLLLLPTLNKRSAPEMLAVYKSEEAKDLRETESLPPVTAPPSATVPLQKTITDRETLKKKERLDKGINGPVVAFDELNGGIGGGGGGNSMPDSRTIKEESPALNGSLSLSVTSQMEVADSTVARRNDFVASEFKDITVATTTSGSSFVASDMPAMIPPSEAQKPPLLAGAKTPATIALNGTPEGFSGGGNRAQFAILDKAKLPDEMPSQRFYRLPVPNEVKLAAPPPTASRRKELSEDVVLNSFTIQQDGNKITVVDNDNSTYSGYIQLTAAGGEDLPVTQLRAAKPAGATESTSTRLARAVAPASAGAVNAPSAPQNITQTYFFRVVGTNRSLNEAVVFSGNLVASSNQVVVVNGGTTAASNTLGGFQFEQTPQSLLLNSRIEGRARVGGKSEIEINAAAVKP